MKKEDFISSLKNLFAQVGTHELISYESGLFNFDKTYSKMNYSQMMSLCYHLAEKCFMYRIESKEANDLRSFLIHVYTVDEGDTFFD